MFYDVPLTLDISHPREVQGRIIAGGQMSYAIFDCPFKAMSYAAATARREPYRSAGIRPQVLRRVWGTRAFDKSVILDLRGAVS